MKFFDTGRTDYGEDEPLCKTDVEGRRLGERIGLDTLVVQAENNECYMLIIEACVYGTPL